MKRKVLVLGAGVQGCCTALELANRGFNVDLIEQDSIPFNRSSIRNEGKIHLGLVYMNDPGFETPRLMLKGALKFSDNLERWIGKSAYDLNISTPFWYLVSNESFLKPDELQQGYHLLQQHFEDTKSSNGRTVNYLGIDPDQLTTRATESELAENFNIRELQAGFKTQELAIDTFKLAGHIRKAVEKNPDIQFLGGHKVESVSLKNDYYIVEGLNDEGAWHKESLQVVNATWMSKYKIDQSLGIPLPPNILFRLKYRVIAKIPEMMKSKPSATMVIGRFGDVVIRPDLTAYLSWYPDACRGWWEGIQAPDSWDEPCKGIVPREEMEKLSDLFISATEKWYPEVKKFKPEFVDAGTIVALGRTDVHNEDSQLHNRSHVGVSSYGGFHSVETGKLTTAPMFAIDTADNVEAFYQLL